MSRDPITPHRLVQPADLVPARGYAHAVIAAPGRTVYLGGQIACDITGAVIGTTFLEQFGFALDNIVSALRACGGRPEHLTSMTIYATDVDAYRGALSEVGQIYRQRIGKHFPAMALVGVTELVEREALVEITATAVIPE